MKDLRRTPEAPARPAERLADPRAGSIEVKHGETEAARTGISTELVDLLTDSIQLTPERADLWMMRFEMFRSLGMKAEYLDALVDAWNKPRVRRVLDWTQIRLLWDSLAPGEGLPIDIGPAAPAPAPPAPAAEAAAAPWQGNRRFADVALQVAGEELNALSKAYATLRAQPGFYSTFAKNLGPILNRPSPLQLSEGLTRDFGGQSRIYLKREDKLRHSPELGNAAAQSHLATALGKPALVTGCDVDSHALALAMIAPRFGLKLMVFVRAEDVEGKAELVTRLRQFGAQVEPAPAAPSVTKDPREAALRFWQAHGSQFHLALSLGTGPRPYPTMVSDFQSLLGRETVLQLRAQTGMTRPWSFVASVFSEADSIGFMVPHLGVQEIPLYYAEPDRASSLARSSSRSRAYNGHRREHAWLKASGRIGYGFIPDAQAQTAQEQVKTLEGFDISLEDARAIAEAGRLCRASAQARDIVVLVA
jgi:tryptophan synthase beta chain